MEKTLNLTLKVWKQNGPREKGRFETYKVSNISVDSSFLEMMDILNEQLINEGKEPVAFDHDCREGICACARSTSTVAPTGPTTTLRPVSCTCASSRTVKPSS